MSSPLRRLNFIFRTLALICLLLSAGFAHGQNVILHLRNGDRIGGVILSENTNQLVLSNTWIKELTIPLAQIEKRETAPPPTNGMVVATGTNFVPGTNVVLKLASGKLESGKLPVNTNTFWRRWKGDASVGMEVEKGASDHELYYGRANLTYAQPYAS